MRLSKKAGGFFLLLLQYANVFLLDLCLPHTNSSLTRGHQIDHLVFAFIPASFLNSTACVFGRIIFEKAVDKGLATIR
jgi:hypothetical protein